MAEKSTQEFVPIKEVRDGIAILKDGSMRSILLTSSVNFSLKSADEQQSILYQFQNFLNSLDFSIQIVIQSRRLDIRPYLSSLEQKKKEQTNDLMKVQIKEYSDFIKTFTDNVNVMTKNFFIVVPYSPAQIKNIKAGKNLFKKNKDGSDRIEDKNDNFDENKLQMEQRISVVEQGITRAGIRSSRLGTEELIEVYYRIFNPGDTGEVTKTSLENQI